MLFPVLHKYIYYPFKQGDWFCQVTVRTHSLLEWEGKDHAGTAAVGEELCRHSPRPLPIPAAAWGAPQSSRGCTNAASTVEHCKRSLKDVLWASPLPPLQCQITAGATESHQHQDAESRDRAPVDFRRNANELRSKFNKNFITFCFHKMMQLEAELS